VYFYAALLILKQIKATFRKSGKHLICTTTYLLRIQRGLRLQNSLPDWFRRQQHYLALSSRKLYHFLFSPSDHWQNFWIQVCVYVRLAACLFSCIQQSVCPPIHQSIYLSMWICLHQITFTCTSISIHSFIHPSIRILLIPVKMGGRLSRSRPSTGHEIVHLWTGVWLSLCEGFWTCHVGMMSQCGDRITRLSKFQCS
jgi:hypothetical protein